MRICITGASGNVGTALLRRLGAGSATGPRHELVGVSRRRPTGPPYDGISWHEVDLAEPTAAEALAPAVAGADAVVHTAWGFQPSHDEAYLEALGVGGTRAVLQASRAAGVGHLVHLSSLGAYSPGSKDVRVDESWPTQGIPTSPYSRHKVTAERLLDAHEDAGAAPAVARVRPAVVVQRDAASGLLRYALPAVVPNAVVTHLPVLPLDRDLVVQVVHADDVADAIARVLEQRATGAFNLAAEPPATRDVIAAALGARPVHVPVRALGALAAAAWRLHLQPVDPGWVDLAGGVPLLDSGRARRELGWAPAYDTRAALDDLLAGVREGAATPTSPVLRPRAVASQLLRSLRRGPLSSRRLP